MRAAEYIRDTLKGTKLFVVTDHRRPYVGRILPPRSASNATSTLRLEPRVNEKPANGLRRAAKERCCASEGSLSLVRLDNRGASFG